MKKIMYIFEAVNAHLKSSFSKGYKTCRRLFYHIFYPKYGTDEIINVMKGMGVKEGDTIFIHSAYGQFFNYTGSPNELIKAILVLIGKNGTLMMPAYPSNVGTVLSKCYHRDNPLYNPNYINFDVNNTKSGAGYLSEVFRLYPGVKRSINVQHSVCAIGRLADYYLSENYKSITAWDEFSPYYKMTITDAKVFTFGLPKLISTVIHCTESALRLSNRYFAMHFERKITYNYKDSNGNIGSADMLVYGRNKRICSQKKIMRKYFDKSQLNKEYLSGLEIKMTSARYTHQLFMSLAEKGITMYTYPAPKGYIL